MSSLKPRRTGNAAILVAAGIMLSRLSGLVREYLFARYLGGRSDAADAWRAAFRIPNFLQNLFGEGVLSASFIPVYAGLLARGEKEEAGRVAGAVLAILALVTSILTLLGMLATPLLVDAITLFDFTGAKRELTITLVRILFPGAGLLVISAWCLGVLNSHRRFFLSYSVSVLWNLTIIGAMLAFRSPDKQYMTNVMAWASVAGSALVVLAQLPLVLRLIPALRVAFATHLESVRTVIRNFGPVFVSRGVIQISSYIDSMIATEIPGGIAMYGYMINIAQLPTSLFGMAVSASELPAMSSATGTDSEIAAYLRGRLGNGLRQITLFVVPSVVAFAALGDIVIGALLQSGEFHADDTLWGWTVLAGSAVGLLASTQGRLYSSTFYALKDTRTPLRFAIVRIMLTTVLGFLCAKPLPHWLGIDPNWGTAGLTASAGVSGWVEYVLLRRSLAGRIGATPVGVKYLTRLWSSALVAAAIAWAIKLALPALAHAPKVRAVATLIPYGLVYFLLADPSQIMRRLKALRR